MLEIAALILAIWALIRSWETPSLLINTQEAARRGHEEREKLRAELGLLRQQMQELRAELAALVAAPPAVLPRTPEPAVEAVTVVVAPAPPTTELVLEVEPPVLAAADAPALPLEEFIAEMQALAPASAPEPSLEPEPLVLTTAPPEPAPRVLEAIDEAPAAVPAAAPPVGPPVPPIRPRRPVPAPQPEPTGPTWWERAATVLLENWTGILGAIVLVTGVGFLGIYTALKLAPPYRFLLICTFAAGLLGGRYALRSKAFAQQLNAWLLSSAAAIFLFACVGAVSIPGLRWATTPFDYLLLLAGVSANLYLAWRTSRQEVATLHGVLSLVALAVLPPTAITLGAAAGVTAFSIAITYRQRWRYQLLLSIASFFAFHLYWHQELTAVPNGLRLSAMALVLLVGVAAAVVQYRRVYAQRQFEPLLFAAHVLNWTCLGINLYLYSTGSVWKTIPLGLGSLLTFWAGRHAKQLGIGWLFQTDTILSLILALATALSLQGWHATPALIGLFMLLESLLIALIMARQSEALVYRVALVGAGLTSVGLLLVTLSYAGFNPPPKLYRDALVLVLGGWAGLAFMRAILRQLLLTAGAPAPLAAEAEQPEPAPAATATATNLHHQLLSGFAGLAGLLQAGGALLVARALFAWAGVPVLGLMAALVGLGLGAIGLATWVRAAGLAPNWVRRQQLVVGQLGLVLAVFGLHELHLSWPTVLLALYAETLLAVLLLARRDSGLHRAALAGALLAGLCLLLAGISHVSNGPPATLYRDALVLALAAGISLVFARGSFRLPSPGVDASARAVELHYALLHCLAGLAGLLQAATGLLLMQVLSGWSHVPVGLLLGALGLLAALALASALWLRRTAEVPAWMHRQQLVASQYFVVLAIFGLHQLGLSWPGVWLVLYAENLVVALLLNGRDEDALLRVQTHLLVVQAALLPWLLSYASPRVLGPLGRAALLVGAALLTLGYQLRQHYWPRAQAEFARLPLGASLHLPLLGLAVGWLLLGAGQLAYTHTWAGWVALGLLSGLLLLRRRTAVPGLWAGIALAAAGYMALQWASWRLWPSPMSSLFDQVGYYQWGPGWQLPHLLYLLPTAAVPLVALATYWWPARQRFARWPWLYLLGAHLAVAITATSSLLAYQVLGLLGLAVAAFGATLLWRRILPDAAAIARAGQPDRYLLHLAYVLLGASLVLHLGLLSLHETFFGRPAEYYTAAVLFAALAGLALAPAPATEPVYRSWRWLHPWLPEVALLFGSTMLFHFVRGPWLPLLWVGGALVLSYFGPQMPLRFRRLAAYGRLYYWLAAASVGAVCLTQVSPAYILRPDWWALTTATALLFGYVGLALRERGLVIEGLSPAWDALARPTRHLLVTTLLYPAFGALSLLLVQSFDRSVLTVLLMLEVVAVFSSSLLLRRQDLRYLALAGMLGCLVRLVFFDLSRSGTITRAVVFIFMGLLLLGMNALYARFKDRFADNSPLVPEADLSDPDFDPTPSDDELPDLAAPPVA